MPRSASCWASRQVPIAGRFGIRLVLVQLGDREQRFQQFVDAGALGGAGLHDFHVAAPFAGLQLVGATGPV